MQNSLAWITAFSLAAVSNCFQPVLEALVGSIPVHTDLKGGFCCPVA